MVRRAHRHGVVTLLDAYRDHGRTALEAAPTVLKINRAELAELADAPLNTVAARVAAYRNLRDSHGVCWVMVTAAAEGMEAYDGTRLVRATPPAVPVVNSIGSGDAAAAGVIAGIVAAAGDGRVPPRLEGVDLAVAARLAVACGSANCRPFRRGLRERQLPLPHEGGAAYRPPHGSVGIGKAAQYRRRNRMARHDAIFDGPSTYIVLRKAAFGQSYPGC